LSSARAAAETVNTDDMERNWIEISVETGLNHIIVEAIHFDQ
jgi:hypothetical protein